MQPGVGAVERGEEAVALPLRDLTIVARDDGSDKPWLAVGRDPADGKRDNLYVVWTSFQPDRAELRLARSTDGGATWSAQKTIFAPVDTGPGGLSAQVQFANPTVDPTSIPGDGTGYRANITARVTASTPISGFTVARSAPRP